MNDIIYSIVVSLIRALQKGGRRLRAVAIVSLGLALIGFGFFVASNLFPYPGDKEILQFIGTALLGSATIGAVSVTSWERFKEQERSKDRIEKVEERAREHPERPQLAWDLARTKLESYLDRNLSQMQSIYWLTLLVMFGGFCIVGYGLLEAFNAPSNLPVTLVSSASGIIISFIGGSFLLIYRSVLSQSRNYVVVLERINAVGMAVQVLGTIADDAKELKNNSTATLAKQLIDIYARGDTRSADGTKPEAS